ncbi:GTPase HflX [Aggregatilineales bacterium SYSU G02658]
MKAYITTPEAELALLVGASVKGTVLLRGMSDSLDELERLAETAGIRVVGRLTQQVNHIDPSTFVGSGKVKEIQEKLLETGAKVVIFDDELSPRHQRELSKHFGNEVKLLDRSALILDIFAQHARTREGALQVELAQYEYRLPRLTRQWTHLARQGGGGAARGGNGGVGLRGPGETQLEVDKREIGMRIAHLKTELEQVRRHRSLHRAQRRKSGIPVAAIVGYTNAGKSTLLNALSAANIYVADQLFATLDPTTRRIRLPSGREILITDTVGFIQKLPATLVAAFRATLEEIVEADILLHVVDMSDPHAEANIEAVEDTLAEIDMPRVPRVLVWNKADRVSTPPQIELDSKTYKQSVMISAQNKTGLETLLETIEDVLNSANQRMQLLIPFQRGDLLTHLFQVGTVHTHQPTEHGTLIEVTLPPAAISLVQTFTISEKEPTHDAEA